MEFDAKLNVLIAGKSEGYLLRSVKNGFAEKEIEVTYSDGDIDSLPDDLDAYRSFIIFADDEFIKNMQFLVYIKDIAIENDIPVFAIGYDSDVKEVTALVPEYLMQKIFLRPINANEVVRDIASFLQVKGAEAKKKILVVDDSAADLRSIRNLLNDKYQVILKSSGASALMYLYKDQPDLILLDYEMPIADGRQVLKMIRGEEAYAKTPVIFLTAKGDKESIMSVMQLHPDGYLLKSMDLNLIKNSIDEFFEKRK